MYEKRKFYLFIDQKKVPKTKKNWTKKKLKNVKNGTGNVRFIRCKKKERRKKGVTCDVKKA